MDSLIEQFIAGADPRAQEPEASEPGSSGRRSLIERFIERSTPRTFGGAFSTNAQGEDRGTKRFLAESLPLGVGTSLQAADVLRLYGAAERAEKGQASDEDLASLERFLDYDVRPQTTGSRTGDLVANSLQAAPGLITGAGIGSKAAGSISRSGAVQFIRRQALKAVGDGVGGAVARGVGRTAVIGAVGAAANEALSVPAQLAGGTSPVELGALERSLADKYRIGEDEAGEVVVELNKDAEGFWAQVPRAFTEQAVEIGAEFLGGSLAAQGGDVGKVAGLSLGGRLFERVAGEKGAEYASRILKTAGRDGLIAELGEEAYGAAVQDTIAALSGGRLAEGGNTAELFAPENLGPTVLGVGLLTGGLGGASALAGRAVDTVLGGPPSAGAPPQGQGAPVQGPGGSGGGGAPGSPVSPGTTGPAGAPGAPVPPGAAPAGANSSTVGSGPTPVSGAPGASEAPVAEGPLRYGWQAQLSRARALGLEPGATLEARAEAEQLPQEPQQFEDTGPRPDPGAESELGDGLVQDETSPDQGPAPFRAVGDPEAVGPAEITDEDLAIDLEHLSQANGGAPVVQAPAMNRETRFLAQLSRRLGARLVPVQSETGEALPVKAGAQPRPGVVLVDVNNADPDVVLAHELVHNLAGRDVSEWRSIRDRVRDLDPEGFAAARASWLGEQAQGADPDSGLGAEEVFSTYAEDLAGWINHLGTQGGQRSLRRILTADPTLFERIVETVKRALRALGVRVPSKLQAEAERAGVDPADATEAKARAAFELFDTLQRSARRFPEVQVREETGKLESNPGELVGTAALPKTPRVRKPAVPRLRTVRGELAAAGAIDLRKHLDSKGKLSPEAQELWERFGGLGGGRAGRWIKGPKSKGRPGLTLDGALTVLKDEGWQAPEGGAWDYGGLFDALDEELGGGRHLHPDDVQALQDYDLRQQDFEEQEQRDAYEADRDSSADGEVPFAQAKRKGRKGTKKKAEGFSEAFETPQSDRVIDRMRVRLQDKLLPLRRYVEELRAQGGEVELADDPYLAAERFPGKVEVGLEKVERTFIEPILETMRKADLDVETVDDYLHALHAEERNRHIAEKFPDQGWDQESKPGSGMKLSEAETIIAEASTELRKIGRLVRRMNREARKRQVADGLISKEVGDLWGDLFEHYVPLRNEEGELGAAAFRVGGQGFTVTGDESKHASGRRNRPGSPLTWAVVQAQTAVVRGEKAKVGQALLRTLEQNSSLVQPEIQVKEEGREIENPEVTFSVKRDGETVIVRLGNQRLARAVKNLGTEYPGPVLRTLGKFTSFLRAGITQYDPGFVASNLSRDFQTALANLSEVQGQVPKIKRELARGVGPAFRAALAQARGKPVDGPWGEALDHFLEDGARTGWYSLAGFEGTLKDLKKELGRGVAWRSIRTVGRAISDVNLAVENATRLSAYKALVDAGVPRLKAASLAKNLTTNFNRHGEVGPWLNVLYMFSNAGIQGTHRLFAGLKNSRDVRRTARRMVLFAAALDVVNRLMSPDDEDGLKVYDKVPDYIRERNLVLVNPFWTPADGLEVDPYYKLPLPYGFNMFHAAGTQVGAVSMGARSGWSASKEFTSAALGAFNPLGDDPTVSPLQFISPTITDPLVQLGENQNFYGGPIKPESFPGEVKPESERYFPGVSDWAKGTAAAINRWTGGDRFTPGAVDVSPEVLDHVTEFLGGSVFRQGQRTLKLLTKDDDVDTSWADVPVVRRFIGTLGGSATRDIYFELREEVARAKRRVKVLREEGATEAADKAEAGRYFKLDKELRRIERERKALRDARDEPGITEGQVQRSRRSEERLMMEMIKLAYPEGKVAQ